MGNCFANPKGTSSPLKPVQQELDKSKNKGNNKDKDGRDKDGLLPPQIEIVIPPPSQVVIAPQSNNKASASSPSPAPAPAPGPSVVPSHPPSSGPSHAPQHPHHDKNKEPQANVTVSTQQADGAITSHPVPTTAVVDPPKPRAPSIPAAAPAPSIPAPAHKEPEPTPQRKDTDPQTSSLINSLPAIPGAFEDQEEVRKKEHKVRILEQMFEADKDHGYLDKDKLRFMLEKLHIMDSTVHEFLWRRYDQDYNGKVDFEEFCAMMLDVIDIKKNFEKADLDHNGSISKDEITIVLERLGISLDQHTITILIDLFDNNRNGVVDFPEFFPLSIYLQELIYEYERFKTRKSDDTEWLRPFLGEHPDEDADVARKLKAMTLDGNFPSMDEFIRVIVTAASTNNGKNFRTAVKAPYIMKVRSKQHAATKTKLVDRQLPPPQTKRAGITGLYEDSEFPPNNDLIPQSSKPKEIVWKRPSEIISQGKPELFVDGVEEGDVIQGALGDCWFLGALAVVAASSNEYVKHMFEEALIEQGYYRIRFFKDGKWVSVEVDDRLPCHVSKNGSYVLYMASCKDEREIWVPIVEKAYAKLHGSYKALEGGNICDALKDLTGGAIEILRWKDSEREEIWNKLKNLSKERSLMGCSIDSSSAPESSTDGGLLVNHAYSILKCKEVDGVKFLRIRNPWGEGEWNGDWSDKSPLWTDEWRNKKFVGKYNFEDDGTFFMKFEDFIRYFNRIFVMRSCYREARWIKHGEWKKGVSASGCKNNPFWLSNPQYAVRTSEPDTKIFINLSQPDLRYFLKQNPGEYKSRQEYESIGLYVLKTNEPRFKKMVYHDEDKQGATSFTDMRDISFEFVCAKPDTYILLPCTYHADREAHYLVSLYSEKPVEVLELPAKKQQSINGSWKLGISAGGCSNHKGTWMSNPQFLLQCSSSGTVDILLAQSGKNGIAPIGIYVFPGEEKMERQTVRAIERPTNGMPEEASYSTSISVDQNESYLILPATLDPFESDFTLTVISENIKVFRLL